MHALASNPLKKNLYTLIKLSKADLERRFAKAKVGVTPLQYGVLNMIKPKPITINEISWQLNFKAPSVVPVVDVLEKKNLLKRKADPKDRRKTKLVITPKGKELLNKLPFDDKNDALNRAFNKLSSPKQKQLLTLLQELTNNFSL